MNRILIIEDDPAFLSGVKMSLEEEHYHIMTETNGRIGYARAVNDKPDLLLLDLMLPGMNGEEICRKLREEGFTIPIVVLTAKDEEIDEILLLEMGADEYLKKTISPRLLKARIQNALRSKNKKISEIESVKFGDVQLDFKRLEATKKGKNISLMTREFLVLKYLISHADEVVSRDDLLDHVWEDDVCPTPRTVDNYILSIRKKLEDDRERPRFILTVPRAGYKFSGDESLP